MASEIKPQEDILIPPTRSRMGRLMGIQVVGIGSSAPEAIIRNEDLASLGYDADWIVQRTGILERRHAPEGTATSDMAVEAARRCIDDAGVDPQDIDLLVLGTFTPDTLMPATACLVQERLGLRCPATDLHAACAGFIYALIFGGQFLVTGNSKLVMVIGADCNSRVLNPDDKKTYPLFGDAAGAVLLAPGSQQQGLPSYAFGADGSGAELLWRPMGGTRMPYASNGAVDGLHFMHMQGKPIFKWAIRMLEETIGEVLNDSGRTLDEVNLVIFHQANMRIISSVTKSLHIDQARVFNNLDRYGNTSGASIPLALDEAHRQGRIRRGDLLLFSGFGAGLAWGTVLMQW